MPLWRVKGMVQMVKVGSPGELKIQETGSKDVSVLSRLDTLLLEFF